MHTIYMKMLEWVLPVVLGPIVYYVAREILNASTRIDDLPAPIKRVAVVLIGGVVTAVFGALHLVAPEACVALTDSATVASHAVGACAAALGEKVPVQGVTAAIVAMIVHNIKKQNPRS